MSHNQQHQRSQHRMPEHPREDGGQQLNNRSGWIPFDPHRTRDVEAGAVFLAQGHASPEEGRGLSVGKIMSPTPANTRIRNQRRRDKNKKNYCESRVLFVLESGEADG